MKNRLFGADSSMETLMVQANSKEEIKIFSTLAKKLGLKSKFISIEEFEDIALANAMETGRTGKFVNTEDFLKKIAQILKKNLFELKN